MIRTALCEILGIEHSIIQAGMGTWTSADLVAAVSNAGGRGSISTFLRPVEDFKRQLASIQELTVRPFAVNHVVPDVTERMELFDLGLQARPRLVSFARADPSDLVDRARQASALVMHQVHTVDQAQQAAERGVDIIVGTPAASAALIRVGVEGRMMVPWTSRTESFIGGGTSITCASALSSGAERHR